MLLHYINIALRNLARQKVLSFINVFGLSVGIACFSLFLLYAVNEFSYDRFHKNATELFRVIDWNTGDASHEPGGDASSYTPLGPAMKQDLPSIADFARVQGGREHFVKVGDRVSRAEVSFADHQLFTMFSFPLIAGNAANALKDPNGIVLTREKALQLFGTTDVVGKRIDIKTDDEIGQFEAFKVSAVAEDIPTTSTIRFEILGNFDYILASEDGKASAGNWHMTIGINTYIQLQKGSGLANNENQLARFRHKYYEEEEAEMKKEGRWNGSTPYPFSFRLQPLREMHTSVNVDAGPPGSTTNPKNLWILIGISAGILLIACINFTTLAIGRSAGRAKEVGVRKVIGSGRGRLIYQFLTESMVLTIFSTILGLLLANLLLPFFSQLCGSDLHFSAGNFSQMAWILVGLVFLVGLLAGSYPALVLSSFRPVEVLKSKVRLGGSNLFTKSLVTFQFVLSVGLIISTLVIFRQLHFLRSKNLGLSKENVVVINVEGVDARKTYALLKHDMQAHREVIGMTSAVMGLGEGQGQMGGGFSFGDKGFGAIDYPVDPDFIRLMDMKLIAGRNFDPAILADSVDAVVVNETLVNTVLGMPAEKAIGQQITKGRAKNVKTIIGVTKDFNFEALNRPVRAQLFSMPPSFIPRRIFVRIQAGDPSAAIASLEAAWKKIVPGYSFNYSFLDEDLDRFYKSEEKWSSIVGWAGGISIFLASLGLFGLAALATVNRTKEIGIRKVMGASVISIVGLLTKNFLVLVFIAMLIASPLAWYFMNRWLQDYAYRINIGWWVFAVTGFVALVIAFCTISLQAVKAALANPVESLGSE